MQLSEGQVLLPQKRLNRQETAECPLRGKIPNAPCRPRFTTHSPYKADQGFHVCKCFEEPETHGPPGAMHSACVPSADKRYAVEGLKALKVHIKL